ncbi:hepatocyte growth factor-regulated tyrosine kinase substrate-like isoform X1 [Centruroides sculpturatus]|uniref:hepatocyte growth factor-regulated tyrosine kinase substrate-like isoform X1 n=2 Tax=Centruroides sculpturatus TaxID=218467 RepID=UPI000C6DF171|nr:hepatocyte growth factor-regulated tyrosine kinase substrate-like isoform X1 [Centruroides sculpturatus]
MFTWTSSNFDKLLEKATSHLQLEPDWNAILQICDSIRQGDVQAKYAINAIKKKLYAQNPHVALFALQVLESCVKNCGSPVHQEVSTRAFMEELRELAKITPNDDIKNKILELIQTWAHAFRNEPNYRAVQDTVSLMNMEGFKFPVLKESDAMFAADAAPKWADGDCCHRCRVQFSMVQRKHHCRNCGQIFCNKCSSRTAPIPRYGIEREVRICELCWDKLNRSAAVKETNSGSEQSPSNVANKSAGSGGTSGGKSEQELQEEEELQLALALSQSEAESQKERTTGKLLSNQKDFGLNGIYATTETSNESLKESSNNAAESELAHYLNRSFWEKKQQEGLPHTRTSPVPSAPSTVVTSQAPKKLTEKFQNGEMDKMQEFLFNLRSTLEIFVNRMKSNSSRGRPLANDTYVQSLFMNITNMHSQLLKYIQEQDDLRVQYEGLQDKLAQIRDARAALDSLREEHREHRRREAEEAERQRQIQMAHKLEIMRKKKQEYLQYQRQLALQRMQEQEREMQLRQEQQKQQYQVMQQGTKLPPVVYSGPPPPPQPSYVPPPSNVNYRMPPPGTAGGNSPAHPPFVPGSFGPSNPAMVPSNQAKFQPQPFNMQGIPSGHPQFPQMGQYPPVPGTATTAAAPPGPGPIPSVPPGVMNPPRGPIDSAPRAILPQQVTQPGPNAMPGHQIVSPTNPPMSPPSRSEQQPPPSQPPQPSADSQNSSEGALISFD